MTTTPDPTTSDASDPSRVPVPVSTLPPVRKAYRHVDDRLIAGVCSGLAAHLHVSVWIVRVVMVVLAVSSGAGIVAYLILWFLLPPQRGHALDEPPGLSAASRAGMRIPGLGRLLPVGPVSTRGLRSDLTGQVVALGAVGIGLVVLAQVLGIGVRPQLLIPLLLVAVAVVLVWRQADDTDSKPVSRRARTLTIVRVVAGFVLVAAAVTLLALQATVTTGPGGVLLGAVCVLGGVGLLAAPWVQRLVRELEAERSERIRTQERADMAAHLHDSVLQTLALIQQQVQDPKAVARLARAQERDLRGWLYYGQRRNDTATLAQAVRAFAADVEDEYAVAVEVVCVGDLPMTDQLDPLVAAGREACVNAAKHSGCDTVDVYAEVTPADVELFVRDRGPGFDPETVADQRMGVRGSIFARMQRHGGTAVIRSEAGYGTEVRLRMPLRPTPPSPAPKPDAPADAGTTTGTDRAARTPERQPT
ncbi:MAG TPA: PspC domain-containing protein [Actinopolymorphaceae bacterium]|jgi:signal transduction histidine kinase/phage shock protein PspC (stress-responsive transcriptional regulator)